MNFLSDILARKRLEVAERRARVPESTLEAQLPSAAGNRSLKAALSAPRGPTRIIAEVKRASPSAGSIRDGLQPAELARQYARAGASAISVLTDGPGFGGSLEDLKAVRGAVSLPLLRKDFILDRYQLLEAKAYGADVVLLIVAALSPSELRLLAREASELGLETLVEVHHGPELEVALEAKCELIGINNRNLSTFQVNLETTERLLPRIHGNALVVSESGVKGPAEVTRLRRAGASNFLVGEALVRAEKPAALLRSLLEA
jgi:indole-3-glycerol phosphate synthase